MDTIKRARARLAKRASSERGAGLVEYLFLTAMIAIVCMVAVTYFGNSSAGNMQRSANALGGITATQTP